MLFKKKPTLIQSLTLEQSCQGQLTTTAEKVDIYSDDTVVRYYTYSIRHFDNIDDIPPLNYVGQKIYNQLTGYKEELTNS